MNIDYVQTSSKEQAFQTVKENITEEKMAKFQVKAKLTDNGTDLISASGKGFDLHLNFSDNSLKLELKLSLLLRPLKGQIEGALAKEIKKVI